ncbi:MAG: helix-turn-helix transcriptional regulator [Gammaproteobacteria bacterium]|jgi:transcriptional regulator with XRE-family HTH domain|nr:helix-turn-helix transcriptional regulator [Candidatus Neomarinimicrobiota bacterium]MBT6668480.1 helix-turn-helix transcriptional regulator [Gammaproteobacteria bacterium]
MNLAQRIRQARKEKQLSQTQLASILGVSRGACGQWEAGISSPSSKRMESLVKSLGVNFEWLTTGRGEAPVSNEIANQQLSSQTSLMPEDLQAFNLWILKLPEDEQRPILKMLNNIQQICTPKAQSCK